MAIKTWRLADLDPVFRNSLVLDRSLTGYSPSPDPVTVIPSVGGVTVVQYSSATGVRALVVTFTLGSPYFADITVMTLVPYLVAGINTDPMIIGDSAQDAPYTPYFEPRRVVVTGIKMNAWTAILFLIPITPSDFEANTDCRTLGWTTYVPEKPFKPGVCYSGQWPSRPPDNAEGAQQGTYAIGNGDQIFTVTLPFPRVNNAYTFTRLYVENLVDSEPLVLTPQIVGKSESFFTVALNSATDSANYRLIWGFY